MNKLRYGAFTLLVLTAVIISCWNSAFGLSAPNETNVSQMPPVQLAGETQDNSLLYSDDFSDPTSGWKRSVTEEKEFRYQDGRYYITALIPDAVAAAFVPEARIFKDFTVEVKAYLENISPDGEYGLDIRDNTDTGDFYRFVISADGSYRIYKYINGGWIGLTDWTKSSAIKDTGSNAIKIDAVGDKFTFYVNGKKLGESYDSSLTSGEIALFAESVEDSPIKIGFDDLKIWAVNSTATTS